jgi:hypothetical protein
VHGAPGPTAITVASGSGLNVAEVGRNIPDVISESSSFVHPSKPQKKERETHNFGFEALD